MNGLSTPFAVDQREEITTNFNAACQHVGLPRRQSTLLRSVFLDEAFNDLLPMQPSIDNFLNTCLDSRPSLMLPGRLSSITMTDSLDLSWLNEPSSSIPSTTSTTPMAIEQPPSIVQSEISQPLPAPATTTSTPQSMVYQAFPSQMPLTMNAFDYNMMCLMAAGGFNNNVNVNPCGTAEAIAECNRQKAIMQALMESRDNFDTPHYCSAVQAAAVAGGAIGGNVVPSMGFPPQPNTAGDQGVIAMRFASQPKPVLTISTASPVKLSMDTSKK